MKERQPGKSGQPAKSGQPGRPRQPGKASREAQPPSRGSQAPSTPEQQLQNLLTKACNNKEHEDARVGALRSLYALLQTPEGGAAGTAAAVTAWPRLLEMLADTQAAVRQSAATVLGLVGALATRPGGTTPALLFNWALPQLTSSQTNLGAHFWVLTALRECLAALDENVLKLWANAVLTACEGLLDSEQTSVHLLPPLLGVVIQAVRHISSLKARVRNLTDILLGWALDPSLPDSARPHIANTLISFQTGWPREPASTLDWLNNLTNDLEQAASADAPNTVAQLRRLMALSTSLAAISRVCATGLKGIFAGFHALLPRIITCLTTAHAKYKSLLVAPGSIYTALEELCLQVDTLLTVAAGAPTFPDNAPPADSSTTGAPMQLAKIYPEVVRFILDLLSSPGAKAPGLAAPVRLHDRLLQLMSRQKAIPPLEAVKQLLRPESSFSRLRLHVDPSIGNLLARAYLTLLHHSDANVSRVCLSALLTEATLLPPLQLDQHSDSTEPKVKDAKNNSQEAQGPALQADVDSKSPIAVVKRGTVTNLQRSQQLASWSLKLLLETRGVTISCSYVGALWHSLWPLVLPQGPLAGYASLWQLAFSILRDLAPQQTLNPPDAFKDSKAGDLRAVNQTLKPTAQYIQYGSLAERLILLVKAAPLPQAQIAALQWLTQLQVDDPVNTAEVGISMADCNTSTAEFSIGMAEAGTSRTHQHRPSEVQTSEASKANSIAEIDSDAAEVGTGKPDAGIAEAEVGIGLAKHHTPTTWQASTSSSAMGQQGGGATAQEDIPVAGTQGVQVGSQGVHSRASLAPADSSVPQSIQHARDGRGDSFADRPSPRRRAEITHTQTLQPTPLVGSEAGSLPPWRGVSPSENLIGRHPETQLGAAAIETEAEAVGDKRMSQAAEADGGSAAPTAANDRVVAKLGVSAPIWDAILGAATEGRDKSLRLAAARSLIELLELPRRLSGSQLAALTAAAPERLGDVARDIRSAWREILLKAAANEDGGNLGAASTAEGSDFVKAGINLPSWHYSLAMEPQARIIRPAHLAELVSFLARGKALGSWDPGGDYGEWLLRIFSSSPGVPGAVDSLDIREFTSLSMLSWWAIQEAAKHCTAARMRTHFGGPSQSFAALEKVLQHAISAPRAATPGAATQKNVDLPRNALPASSAVAGASSRSTEQGRASKQTAMQKDAEDYAGDYRAVWLLLEFMVALERNIFHAAEGSETLVELPAPVLAFFVANRKVCEDWFARMRGLMLRVGVQVDHHHAVIYHAYARIRELKSQLRTLLTSEVKSSESPAPQAETLEAAAVPVVEMQEEPTQPKILMRRPPKDSSRVSPTASASPLGTEAVAPSAQIALKVPERLLLELTRTLRSAATSLTQTGESEAIQGLHACCLRSFQSLTDLLDGEGAKDSLERSLAWMPSIALHAAGSCEAAAVSHSTVVEEMAQRRYSEEDSRLLRLVDNDNLAFTIAQAAEAYAAVADWDGLEAFLARLEELRADAGKRGQAFQLPPAETNRHLALASFERKDYTTARGLLDLSSWGSSQLHGGNQEAPFRSGKLLAAGESALHHALLSIQTRTTNRGRWREEVATAVEEGRSAALLHLELGSYVGAGSCWGAGGKAPALAQLQCLEAARERSERARGSVRGSSPSGSSPRGASPEPQPFEGDDKRHVAVAQVSATSIYDELAALSFPPVEGVYPSAQLSAVAVASLTRAGRVGGVVDSAAMQPASVGVLASIANSAFAAGNVKMAQTALMRAEQSLLLSGQPEFAQAFRLQKIRLDFSNGERQQAFQQLWQTTLPLLLPEVKGDTARVTAEACRTLANWLAYAGEDAHAYLRSGYSAQIQDLIHSQCVSVTQASLAAITPADMAGKFSEVQRAQLVLLAAGANFAQDSAAAWGAYANFLHNCIAEVPTAVATAFKASCQRLATVQPSQPELAMPELLRLLNLLQTCKDAEVGIMAEQLWRVPPALWQTVVPQLFSALVRPSSFGRRVAGQLLQRLEEAVPAAVLYSALVEQQQADEGVSEELRELVQRCRQQKPQVVAELELMMTEMARITVLPTEHWHTTLTEVQADVSRRLNTLQGEAERLVEQIGLQDEDRQRILAERYTAVMAPAVLVLQRRLRISGLLDPQTPQEAWFQRHFLERLQDVISSLQQPVDVDFRQHKKVLEPLKSLAKAIGGYLSETSVKLSSISPSLASLANTYIPMPGLLGQSSIGIRSGQTGQPGSERLTIASLGPEVEMLHTKTRPKKLVMLASDGRQLTFLLKGREDLRTDERLLQFLRLSSALLQEDPGAAGRSLRVRSFAVTPLGPRVGLIQWVENTKPLFAMYTNWQRRAAAHAAAVKAEQEGKSPSQRQPKEPPRAIDMFYARLVPALEAAGIGKLASRKEWPLEVLRNVMAGLMRDTPRNLLERQIFSGSPSLTGWWRRQQNYSRSTAVMCMVGYLLGLGDRHLDNILLDQRSAEVVHIDFNIVFDRGCKLPVPEIVPFRLTHTVQAALGVTGVEGLFRSSCEAVLAAMRRNSLALKLLMDAVLSDPLVDWVPDREDAAARRGMELAVLLNLFRSRVDELLPALSAALQSLQEVLLEGGSALAAFCKAFEPAVATAKIAHNARLRADEQKAVFEGARQGLRQEWERAQHAATERQEWLSELQSLHNVTRGIILECQAWGERHAHLVGQLQGASVRDLELQAEYYIAGRCQAPLGLVAGTEGVTGAGSILATLKAGYSLPLSIPAELLGLCTAVDERATELFKARDILLDVCAAALKEYAMALNLLLPEYYWRTSYHQQWVVALSAVVKAQSAQAVAAAGMLAPHEDSEEVLVSTWRACQTADDIISKQISQNEEDPALPALAKEAAGRQDEVLRLAADIEPAHRASSLASAQAAVMVTARAQLAKSLEAPLEVMHEALLAAAVPLVRLQRIIAKSLPPEAPHDYPWGSGPVAALQRSAAVLHAVQGITTEMFQCALPVLACFMAAWVPQWQQGLAGLWESLQTWRDLQIAAETIHATQHHPQEEGSLDAKQESLRRAAEEWVARFLAALDLIQTTGGNLGKPVNPLLDTIQALHSLLKRLRAPLDDLARASALKFPGVPEELQTWGFYGWCANLLDKMVPTSRSSDAESALVQLKNGLQAALCQLLRVMVAPIVMHALKARTLSAEHAEQFGPLRLVTVGSRSEMEADNVLPAEIADGELDAQLLQAVHRYAAALAAAVKARIRELPADIVSPHNKWRERLSRYQAACEWLSPAAHEMALAGGRSSLTIIGPEGKKLRSRAELLLALRNAWAELQPLEAAFVAWRPPSSTADRRLEAVIKGKGADLLATYEHYVALRDEWLIISQEQSGKLCTMANAVLAFEASREERIWDAGNMQADAFAAHVSLMDQLQSVAKVLYASDNEVADARRKSVDLQASAAAAARSIQECNAAAQQAGPRFISLAVSLVEAGAALVEPLSRYVEVSPCCQEPLSELSSVLAELCRATKGFESIQNFHQAAARALDTTTVITAEVLGAPLPLRELIAGLFNLDLPSAAAIQEMKLANRTQEFAAGAAAIIDAAVPVWERNGNKMPNLLAIGASANALLALLEQLTASASTVAAAIQQEHTLPVDRPHQLAHAPNSVKDNGRSDENMSSPEPVVAAAFHADTGTPEGVSQMATYRISQTAQPLTEREANGEGSHKLAISLEAGRRATAKDEFASSASRRFAAKLKGDSGASQQISVGEQVEVQLRHASNVDNLARMYEGWTPWI